MQVGEVVDFRFKLLSLLGRGGMGQTFRAEDLQTGKVVAIKTLLESAHPGTEERARKRFRREAIVLGRLRNPHIPEVYEVRPDGEWPYIAMQLIEGVSLRDYLAGNCLPGPPEVASLGIQALDALDDAHQQVLHRDLTPNNIMITNSGCVFLIDFGIALPLTPDATRYTSEWVGTVGYMAPERLGGGEPDAASDLYSLGCLFYEMFAGCAPFVAEPDLYSDEDRQMSLRRQHQEDPPRPLREHVPGLPADLDDLVTGLLAKDPRERPVSTHIREVLTRYRPAPGAPEPNPGFDPDLTLPFRQPKEMQPSHARPAGRGVSAAAFSPGRPAIRVQPDDVALRIKAAQDLHTAGDERAAAAALHALLGETKRAYGKRHSLVRQIEAALGGLPAD
ncbi:serine/threonine-protein kinase [Micromonospora echinospora]|uniref:serine/threonine-protein kinase n=1 Tax=Micromonospora echinospora TaxID=1877 RepID=UPI003671EBB4